MNRDFTSDNAAGAAPEVLAALVRANEGRAGSYGADGITARVEDRFSELFEKRVRVFPVATGTAANVLALSAITPPWGTIYCHEEAHIAIDECGAPEFYTGGAKLCPLPGAHGRVDPADLRAQLGRRPPGNQHETQPAALSLTQITECGTVYRPEDLRALSGVARAFGMRVHMDGARFANAVAHLGCKPADITWRAGIDILSFGATKNGAIAAEAVVFFDPYLAENFLYRRKRGGHLFSKMRFLSAQLEAYLEHGRWLQLASNANIQAQRLAGGVRDFPECEIVHPVEGNEVFMRLPRGVVAELRTKGFQFHNWGAQQDNMIRLITAFDTADADVDGLVAAISAVLSAWRQDT